MKNKKPNSRTMRRQFGGDFKQLMTMFQEVKLLCDAEMLNQPETKKMTLTVGDVKEQLTTLFTELEHEIKNMNEKESPKVSSSHAPATPTVNIKTKVEVHTSK